MLINTGRNLDSFQAYPRAATWLAAIVALLTATGASAAEPAAETAAERDLDEEPVVAGADRERRIERAAERLEHLHERGEADDPVHDRWHARQVDDG